MRLPARYLLLPFFILMVIIAMFFIYSNISSPERVVYYKEKPNFFTEFGCIIKGGAIEEITSIENYDSAEVVNQEHVVPDRATYVCHFH